MSEKNTSGTTEGGGLLFAVFVVFLVLKMTGTVAWSWWWVTCPLWIGPALVIAVMAAVLLVPLVMLAVAGVGGGIVLFFAAVAEGLRVAFGRRS